MAFVNRLLAKQGKECIRAAFVKKRFVAPKISTSLMQYRMAHDDHGHHDDVYVWAKLNEFPVPSESWQEAYDQQQKKYNKQLAMAVGFSALVFAYYIIWEPVDFGLPPPMTNKDLSFWYDNEPGK